MFYFNNLLFQIDTRIENFPTLNLPGKQNYKINWIHFKHSTRIKKYLQQRNNIGTVKHWRHEETINRWTINMTTLKQHIQIHVIYETNRKNQRRMQQEKLSKKGESRKIKFGDRQKMIEPIKEIKKKLKLIEQEEEAKGDGQLAINDKRRTQIADGATKSRWKTINATTS